jgi:NAD-dependent dihydropyrimidine dehydrogenase PreA subunit
MTYVIAEPCIGTKNLSCVEVCPVDCIHPTRDEEGFDDGPQLYIDPEECIDCDVCVAACPSMRVLLRIRCPTSGRSTSRSTPTLIVAQRQSDRGQRSSDHAVCSPIIDRYATAEPGLIGS